jgi:hypothetical protein
MKTFEVEGWYRYSNGDEKDFEKEIIISMNPEDAIESFKNMFKEVRFFKIDLKEVRL